MWWAGMNFAILIISLHFLSPCIARTKEVDHGAKYVQVPMHEVLQTELYVGLTQYGEFIVTYAGKGADMRPDDYITHADNIKLLTGSVQEFLDSGVRETMLPIVDDSDEKYGGFKLLGFVMMQSVIPRKLSFRRGEIEFDLQEGGPPPMLTVGNIMIGANGEVMTDADKYVPPPHGTGKCITSRDCYFYNGTCVNGECKCPEARMGSFCQMERAGHTGISELAQKHKKQHTVSIGGHKDNRVSDVPLPPKEANLFVDTREEVYEQPAATHQPPPPNQPASMEPAATEPEDAAPDSSRSGTVRKVKPKVLKRRAKGSGGDESGDAPPVKTAPAAAAKSPEKKLYGEGGLYPEPYLAGKIPPNLLVERDRVRKSNQVLTYSVRFRTGPIGLAFNNLIQNSSIVETVMPNLQAQLSDVQKGDKLIAVNEHNTTTMPPKLTQRLLQSLNWPMVLVFESYPPPIDEKKLKEQMIQQRTYTLSVIYPPTMVGEYPILLSEFSKEPKSFDQCTVYRIAAPDDMFGCEIAEGEYILPREVQQIQVTGGAVDQSIEQHYSMLTAMYSEKLQFELKSLTMAKRGVCTFVEKANNLVHGGSDYGIVVNTEDILNDITAGKENVTLATIPVSSMKSSDGDLLFLTAQHNELLGIIHNPTIGHSGSCSRVMSDARTIIDKWPHSVPPIPVSKVLRTALPTKEMLRGESDDGGRIAVSGMNGWAFFDYHLALFGPQEVPAGPHRLQMAVPPHGCDPNAYTVRIAGTVVAILRGGGCSFGIKVMNAQKLGAKAVIIVNTDDKKTMRLMALPDEEPLIHIPCIMVSRRIQYYLEAMLRFYYPIDQHMVSIQPTGVFGMYEERNLVTLPSRLPGH